MARSWQYSRWKRVALQVVMVLVLCLSLGLAGLVVRHERLTHQIVLAGPTLVGRFHARFPERWVVIGEPDGAVVVQEPDGDRPGRQLVLGELRIPLLASPVDVLKDLQQPGWVPWQPTDGVSELDKISIAGSPGLLLATRSRMATPDSHDHQTRWLAVAVIRPGVAVSVGLTCPDDTDAADDKTEISAILNGISIAK